MNLHNVQFLKSATHIDQRPSPYLPEIAVIGRSNVGKSSLINVLFNRKNLAKISSTPGKTRFLNYFLVDDLFYFVDLPGYGFARLSKKERESWKKSIESFLNDNKYLRLVFLLLDSRHNLMEIDRQMIEWLQYYRVAFKLIMTKTDKVSNNQFRLVKSKLETVYPSQEIIKFSARSRTGREEIIRIVEKVFQ